MINVTKSYLPSFVEYSAYLQGIWERAWLTNHGPLVVELEEKLKAFLGVKHLFFVNNGTAALQIAIKALCLEKEVITTPFSYVATTSSLVWEGCSPVFVDIDPHSLCINPELIERSITDRTQAILATHVFGNPCHVEAIELIAQKYNLKVIYDAAHAFGVRHNNTSVLNFGDISTLSFHATKLFHTIEGGAIITNDDELAHKISYMSNFGHNGPEKFWGLGINAKNCEFHAAMGLCVLPKVPDLIRKRKEISAIYNLLLQDLDIVRPIASPDSCLNYSYYPVIFDSEETMLAVKNALNAKMVFPRRYFYPSLNTLSYVQKQQAPLAESISARILCLPLYYDLEESAVELIAGIIKEELVLCKSL